MKHHIIKLLGLILMINIANKPLFAQFSEGYSPQEAKDMIAICNSFTFIKVLNSDKAIAPKGYEKVYQSGTIGLDNQWQLWKTKNFAVINFRGSTSEQISWLGNMYSAMIPAQGEIILPGDEQFKYKLSSNSKSNVHSGWTLSTAYLAKDILQHIKMLNYEGIYHFIITGHSQGAAIAQLMRAYLENLPNNHPLKKNQFKTYAFASPMVGNTFFVEEYMEKYSNSSFNLNNPNDPVTKMPFTIDKKKMVDINDIATNYSDTTKNYFEILAYRALGKMLFDNPDSAYIEKAGVNVKSQIEKTIGPFTMPQYQMDMSYSPMKNIIYLGPFTESDIKNKKYVEKFNLNPEESFFQHKPYMYYLYITKK